MATTITKTSRPQRPLRRASRPATIRVVLADSFRISLEALGTKLDNTQGIKLEGTAAGHEAVPGLVRDARPDVLIIDYRLAQRIQQSTWAQMAKTAPNMKAILLAEDDSMDVAAALAQPEVKGAVSRTSDFATLLEAIRVVSGARTWKMPSSRTPTSRSTLLGGLSRRESEIADLVAKGLGNREIAERLELTEQSVKNFITKILRKLGLKNRVQICLWKHFSGTG